MTDAELVRRSLAGENLAFAQLVEKHQRLVFGVALSTARDAAEAEDVAQEAFVEAWRDLRTLRDPKRVGTWMAGIARNLAHRWRRRTARRRNREIAATESDIEAPTPLDIACDRQATSLVRTALAEIPAAYREALVLYYVHQRSVAEVATGLGISEDLAKQRLSRGRRALRTSLERRVEDALGQLKPSNAFAATVMVAVTAATARTAGAAGSAAASGKVLLAMKTTKLIVAGIVLVLAAGIAWHWRTSAPRAREHHGGETSAATAVSTPGTTATASGSGSISPRVRKLASREMRDQLIQAIRAAHEQRVSSARTSTATALVAPPRVQLGSAADDGDADDPDTDYIRESMTALLPTVVDCYKQARVVHPALAGVLVVNFTIEGEPGIGGVVTESAIDPDNSEIKDPDLGRCVEEAMFELEIDPPTNGDTVKVTFPFTFRPKD